MIIANLLLLDALVFLAILLLGIVIARLPARTRASAPVSRDWLVARRRAYLERSVPARLLDPFVRLGAAVVGRLGFHRHRARVDELLTKAGNPWGYAAEEYITFAVLSALFIAGTFFALFWVAGSTQVPITLLAFLVVYFLMQSNLKSTAVQRSTQLEVQLPYFLDLATLSMGAGATFTQACESVAEGPVRGPIEEEVGLMLRQMKAGTTMLDALENLGQRSDSESMIAMVAAVRQATELGTPLVEVFEVQAERSRFLRSQRGEREAGKLPNRLAIPNTLMMFCSLLILFGPVIVKAVRGELF